MRLFETRVGRSRHRDHPDVSSHITSLNQRIHIQVLSVIVLLFLLLLLCHYYGSTVI